MGGVVLFLLVLTAAALSGYGALRRCGLHDLEAWAGGRVFGLVLVTLPAWWLGALGFASWWLLALGLLIVGAGVMAYDLWSRPPQWRQILIGEAVFWGFTGLVLLLRIGHPEILNTEKPMDMGILGSLLRTEVFPPPDMWLAGESLPYYYWGSLVWALPMRISGIAPEIGYNLVVALVGGATAVTVWMLGRRLAGGSHWAGMTAAFFALVAGTPDGMRQLLAGTAPQAIDLWQSSRQVPHTITEFPLFTLWLGDLHPHLLCLPLAAAALLVALEAGRRGITVGRSAVVMVLFGATWAANPWAMPPTLVAVALCLICGDGRWKWPVVADSRPWLGAAAVAVVGWLVFSPFHLAFDPPLQGLGLVSAWTSPHHLILYAGCLLVPVFGAAVVALKQCCGGDEARAWAVVLGWSALTVVAAALSGRIALVFLSSLLLALVVLTLAKGEDEARPAFALAALGVFLFAVPEVLFVRDAYGDQLHRMNTVFKAYIQGWILLALALPMLLHRWLPERNPRRLVTLVLVALAMPHLLAAGLRAAGAHDPGLDGLRWMEAEDRALVRCLREQPPGIRLVEAVGDPYSTYGRLSSASGVPALLGWANHESVWRGGEVLAETGRRSGVVQQIYGCGDPADVLRLVMAEEIDVVAIGSLERRDFDEAGLNAVRSAGRLLCEHSGSALVAFGLGTEAGVQQ